MKTITNFIEEEISKFSSDSLTPEGLQLLLYNVAKNCSDYFVEDALKEASEKADWEGHVLAAVEVDKDSILEAYPLTNIK